MKKLILFLFLLSMPNFLNAQITFQKTFSVKGNTKVYPLFDEGYIISADSFLIRLDKFGDTLWAEGFSGIYFLNCTQTSDSGIIGIGISEYGSVYTNICLVRVNKDGDFLWSKIYDGQYGTIGYSIQQTTDGGYVFCGGTSSYNINPMDSNTTNSYLIKTDASGDTLWTRSFGISGSSDFAADVKQTRDGGYIVVGKIVSYVGIGAEVFLSKFSSNGARTWSRWMGGSNYDRGEYVAQTIDGGYIILGQTWSFGAGYNDTYLIKTDGIGYHLWSKSFGGAVNDDGAMIQQTSDSGYIFISSTFQNDTTALIKLNSIGDTLWTNSYPYALTSVQATADGGYILGGWQYLSNNLIHIIKTDRHGYSGCNEFYSPITITSTATRHSTTLPIDDWSGAIITSPTLTISKGIQSNQVCFFNDVIQLNQANNFISIYPNPTTNEFTINTVNKLKNGIIEIVNSLGNLVYTETILTENKTIRPNLPSGIYFVKISDAENIFNKIIIIQQN